MNTQTPLPPRMRLKHVMTATAFGLVQIRNAWRSYFAQMKAEQREIARRQREHGWG